jgi:cytidine deaminase
MKELTLKSIIKEYQMDELPAEYRQIVESAIESTSHSYAPYSHFNVGACLLLDNGIEIKGCNQENAAFPSGICAERSAIFAAGAQYPEVGIKAIAIAARTPQGELTEEPVSPCGPCRQVIIESETRAKHPIRILLYGKKRIFLVEGIKQLMPLSFTEF